MHNLTIARAAAEVFGGVGGGLSRSLFRRYLKDATDGAVFVSSGSSFPALMVKERNELQKMFVRA